MMGDTVLRVSKLENGYEVEFCDPAIDKANSKPKADYQSPWKAYAFSTAEEVSAFVTSKLDELKPSDPDAEFASSFNEAASKD